MSPEHEQPLTPLEAGLETTAAPHLFEIGSSTRRMMLDVLIGLTPVLLAAFWYFRMHALVQMASCVIAAGLTEVIVCKLRGRPSTIYDGSGAITALILALSLPPRLPLYASIVGAAVAIALGKMVFGGLGHNIFNPAMVGRAFLMVCFPVAMTSWADPITVHATSEATPLAAAKFANKLTELTPLLIGNTSGSVGETSSLAVALGGLWLLIRRAADWRPAVGMVLGIVLMSFVEGLVRAPEGQMGVIRHLCSGGALFAAFFIVTDPVTSPLTKSGRWLFGGGVGVLTMVIRLFAGYPEGVMFSVLICNAVAPLINRWTVPTPLGGKSVV